MISHSIFSNCVTCAVVVDLYRHLVPGGPMPKVLCSEECELSWLAVQALNGTIVHQSSSDPSRWIFTSSAEEAILRAYLDKA